MKVPSPQGNLQASLGCTEEDRFQEIRPFPFALVRARKPAHPGGSFGGDKRMEEMEADGNQDRRPVPVRAAMVSPGPEPVEQTPRQRRVVDPTAGAEWIARITGRSTSGVTPLRVIPLVELTFSLAQAPDVPVRRAICQGEPLEELDDETLLRVIRSAGPAESGSSPPPSSKDRRGGKGRWGS